MLGEMNTEDVSNIGARRTNTSTRGGRNNASLSTQQQSNLSTVASSSTIISAPGNKN